MTGKICPYCDAVLVDGNDPIWAMKESQHLVVPPLQVVDFIQQERRQIEMLKVQVRVGDACSHYHMMRCKLVEEANANANKAIEALCLEIDKLYGLLREKI